MASSEETAVRGRRVRVDAKWPMWNLQRLRSRSPFDDLGSGSVIVSTFTEMTIKINLTYLLDRIEERVNCSHCRQRGYKVSCHQAGNQLSPLPAHPSLCQRVSFCMVLPVSPKMCQISFSCWKTIESYRVSSKPQPLQCVSNKTHSRPLQILDDTDITLHINESHR